jgi:putative glycosyltransferase (TIGR04348 family)
VDNFGRLYNSPMRILLACPAPPRSRHGNRVTALRWSRILKSLGHRITITQLYTGQPCDLLVALHAHRSHDSVVRFRHLHPHAPLLVALTGTDLYHDIHTSRAAQESLDLADRLIVLQTCARDELPAHLRPKIRVLYQSTLPTPGPIMKRSDVFEVCVLGHLRPVKDPFRAAFALRRLPATSQIRVLHAGKALSADMANRAHALMRRDPRYHWLGEIPRWQARRLLARSRLLVLSSRMEGGANVISEAVVDGVPILASRIPGSMGLLGPRYPGYFPVADADALARLLNRAETDKPFCRRLVQSIHQLQPLFDPARERNDWEKLLHELQE